MVYPRVVIITCKYAVTKVQVQYYTVKHTPLRWIYPCILDIPLYTGYTPVYWVYPCILGIPLYTGYTPVYWIYPCILEIPLYTGYTHVYWIYPCILDIPLYTGYTPVYWMYPCILDIPLYRKLDSKDHPELIYYEDFSVTLSDQVQLYPEFRVKIQQAG